MLVCDDCGHTMEQALVLKTASTTRIVCPRCKSPRVLIPGHIEIAKQTYRITVEPIEDDDSK